MPRKGCLFIVSAPSGAGKTTVCRRLLDTVDGIRYSVSYTTRPKRPGEVEGVDYRFVPRDEFETLIREGAMAEWALVHGNYYGTPARALDHGLSLGQDVLVDIDVQGGSRIKAHYPEAVRIFILPPSMEELERRLRARAVDSPDAIDRRLSNARQEIENAREYDYVVVNETVPETVDLLASIVKACRCRTANALPRIHALIES